MPRKPSSCQNRRRAIECCSKDGTSPTISTVPTNSCWPTDIVFYVSTPHEGESSDQFLARRTASWAEQLTSASKQSRVQHKMKTCDWYKRLTEAKMPKPRAPAAASSTLANTTSVEIFDDNLTSPPALGDITNRRSNLEATDIKYSRLPTINEERTPIEKERSATKQQQVTATKREYSAISDENAAPEAAQPVMKRKHDGTGQSWEKALETRKSKRVRVGAA
ncbi:hypothetical protein QBC40DRAFT_294830 [Triangularia verruculosa]|uniref:Uncharacterized protein n=1 Tax=Triangularia verruculosa TaxID=2587418 RepID=A0AAN6XR59_9PEZI|nr:hypothetical protein QBC40DRAFT_294830 [Triangularia verruculosa]